MSNDTKQPELKNILFIARDDGGCGYYRCEQPATFLTRAGLAQAVHVLKKPSTEQLLAADLVILQDAGSVESTNLVNFMAGHGIPFMVELDDFIHHISPNNQAGYPAWNPSTLYLHRATEIMRRAVGLVLATEQLGREYFPYNPVIYVVPNYLDKDLWEVPVMKRQDGKVRIGWAGGNAHADDLAMVSKVIERIVKESKGKVVFETMGMTRKELTGVFSMPPTSENSCPSCGFEGELHHFPGEAYRSYPQVAGSRGWDIAIAPVIDNGFGNAKSELKIKEYAALQCPVVASNVRPYRDAKKHGADIILADSYEEWYNGLNLLIDNPAKRDEMVRANKEWAQGNWIQDRVYDIYSVYAEVIARVEQQYGDRETRLKNAKGVQ